MDATTFRTKDEHQLSNLLKMELRHIEASKLTKLSAIIDKANALDKLLGKLTGSTPRDFSEITPLTNIDLTLEAINLIEKQIFCEKSPTQALLNHWSITGRRRPTIKSLIVCLQNCGLKWAENYVRESILGIGSIDQSPYIETPTNRPDIASNIHDEFKFDNLEKLINGLETRCVRYSFKSIYETTNGFSNETYDPSRHTGTKIGEGRFSSVYRAQTQVESSNLNTQQTVAAKLLKSECNQKYLANEINLIGRVSHENILEFLGIALGKSLNGSLNYICLIYKYMQNGSLLDCLSSGLPTKNMEFLTWYKRIEIAIKIARGISYLHSFHEGPIIHRDIKTANIFINIDLEPKVGDFTLVRRLDTIRTTGTQFSQNVIGTSVYMPPEAFRGDISIKFDTFSFGIVLFELLTGLRPFNEELDEDLFTYINGKLSDIDDELAANGVDGTAPTLEEVRDTFLSEILDKRAGKWDFKSSKDLFGIALQATEVRKKNRPELSSILPILESALPH